MAQIRSWRYIEEDNQIIDGEKVVFDTFDATEEDISNAKLAACAPEMLEMLKFLAGDQYDRERMGEIHRLIAKAKGES